MDEWRTSGVRVVVQVGCLTSGRLDGPRVCLYSSTRPLTRTPLVHSQVRSHVHPFVHSYGRLFGPENHCLQGLELSSYIYICMYVCIYIFIYMCIAGVCVYTSMSMRRIRACLCARARREHLRLMGETIEYQDAGESSTKLHSLETVDSEQKSNKQDFPGEPVV